MLRNERLIEISVIREQKSKICVILKSHKYSFLEIASLHMIIAKLPRLSVIKEFYSKKMSFNVS